MKGLLGPEGNPDVRRALEAVIFDAEEKRLTQSHVRAAWQFAAEEQRVSNASGRELVLGQSKALARRILEVNARARGFRHFLRLGGYALLCTQSTKRLYGGPSGMEDIKVITPPLLTTETQIRDDETPRTGTRFVVHAARGDTEGIGWPGKGLSYSRALSLLDIVPIVYHPETGHQEIIKTYRLELGKPTWTDLSVLTKKDNLQPLPADNDDPFYLDLYAAVASARLELGEPEAKVLAHLNSASLESEK